MNTGVPERFSNDGWSGDNYFSPGREVVEGEPHCIVFSCRRSEKNGVSLFVDGELWWSGKNAFEHRGIDLTGTQLLLGTGKDALSNPKKQFTGELYLLGVAQRALAAEEAKQLTDEMHRQIKEWKHAPEQVSAAARRPRRAAADQASERSTAFGHSTFTVNKGHLPLEVEPAPAVGTGNFTVSVWVRRTVQSHRKYLTETRAATSGAAARGWLFGFYDHRLLLQLNGGDQARWHNFLSESAVSASEEWILVSARVRRTSAIEFFVNGQHFGETPFPADLRDIDLTGSSLLIGCSRDANSAFDGEIGGIVVVHGG